MFAVSSYFLRFVVNVSREVRYITEFIKRSVIANAGYQSKPVHARKATTTAVHATRGSSFKLRRAASQAECWGFESPRPLLAGATPELAEQPEQVVDCVWVSETPDHVQDVVDVHVTVSIDVVGARRFALIRHAVAV